MQNYFGGDSVSLAIASPASPPPSHLAPRPTISLDLGPRQHLYGDNSTLIHWNERTSRGSSPCTAYTCLAQLPEIILQTKTALLLAASTPNQFTKVLTYSSSKGRLKPGFTLFTAHRKDEHRPLRC